MIIHVTFLALIGYILFAVVRGLATGRWAKRPLKMTSAALAVMLMLFADGYAGYFYWKYLCNTRGGMHVYRTVSVSGYEDRNVRRESGAEEILSRGYVFIEGSHYRDPHNLYRYYRGLGGTVVREAVKNPQSRVIFSEVYRKEAFAIYNVQYRITEKETGETLGIAEKFGFLGGWFIRALRDMTGLQGALYCPVPRFSVVELVTSVLEPTDDVLQESR